MTFEKLRDLLVNQLSVDADKVTLEANIIDDLGADSLEVVELLMELENEFGITVPDEKAQEFMTVGDIVSFIDANK